MRTRNFLAQLLLAGLALSGAACSKPWQWRDRWYSIPEEAAAAQREDLSRDVDEVAPVLEERRLRGRCLVALPTEMSLRKVLYPQPGDTAQQFYSTSLTLNQAEAYASALRRAKVFDGVAVEQLDQPSSALPPTAGGAQVGPTPETEDEKREAALRGEAAGGQRTGGYVWLIRYESARGATAWTIQSPRGGATVPFTREDMDSSERYDRFAGAVYRAGAPLRP